MPSIAILIPCHNEGASIAGVIRDFKAHLPDAKVYVCDNNSSDNTVAEALRAGATVSYENRQGKGWVMRSLFHQVEADVYVMVDGDGTYPANKVHELIEPVLQGKADITIGSRLHPHADSRFRYLNRIGNKFFLFVLNSIFRMNITDLLSGYRAMSRQAVKSLPMLSRGFELETELTIKCFERGYRVLEIPVNLAHRQKGSRSKIKIGRDGILILNTIFSLFRDYKPLTVFGSAGLLLIFGGVATGVPVFQEYFSTGAVSRVPLAVLAVGLVLSGVLSLFVGLILHSISRHYKEQDQLMQNLLAGLDAARSALRKGAPE